MSFILYRLNDLISATDEKELQSFLSSFKCSAEPAAEDFLNRVAIKHENNGISRTYLFVDRDDSGTDIIKGFSTIAFKCLTIDERHKIPETIFEQMNVDRGIAQAYLLGQLAKADGVEKGFGRKMINHSFDIFSKGNGMFGCRVVRLDCRDALIKYYESCGFTAAGKNQTGTLNHMIAII